MEYWIQKYEGKEALWIHDGLPARPHALLTSGRHSSGFFNSELITEDPLILDEACEHLAFLIQKEANVHAIDRVVGPAMGAITVAHDLARQIGNKRGHSCLRAYAEKELDIFGNVRGMRFIRTAIQPGDYILLCEDVITTGTSIGLTACAVTDAGGIVLPYVIALINRSGHAMIDGKEIIALINREMPVWEADVCPLCAKGSEAIRPKGTENWARLTAEMDGGAN